MTIRLEHANLLVHDLDGRSASCEAAFRRSGSGTGAGTGRRWVHYGDDAGYLALAESNAEPAEPWCRTRASPA